MFGGMECLRAVPIGHPAVNFRNPQAGVAVPIGNGRLPHLFDGGAGPGIAIPEIETGFQRKDLKLDFVARLEIHQ